MIRQRMPDYRYFHLSNGLRGGYMPDSASVIKVDTRAMFKLWIEDEARLFRDAGYHGASKSAVARLAVDAWDAAKSRHYGGLPLVMPLKPRYGREYSYGLFISPATEQEYKAYLREERGL